MAKLHICIRCKKCKSDWEFPETTVIGNRRRGRVCSVCRRRIDAAAKSRAKKRAKALWKEYQRKWKLLNEEFVRKGGKLPS
jgi:hypothetical protein